VKRDDKAFEQEGSFKGGFFLGEFEKTGKKGPWKDLP
jgi:hypothetical protein